jgi:hypothetical protein
MNILDYRSTENHGLSFELVIDGEPIGKLVGSSDDLEIPYRLFKNGTALFPAAHLGRDSEKRVVAVCSCGEWGCSSTRCDVVKSWDGNIIFRDFITKRSKSDSVFNMAMFCFSPINYDSVVTEISKKIQDHEILWQLERLKAQT